MPAPHRSKLLRAFWVVLLIVQFPVGCNNPTGPAEELDRATQLRESDNPEAALIALRQAMRLAPEDPAIRLLLAEVYLDLQEGNLAITALEQAVARGLPANEAAFPMARALYVAERFAEVSQLPVPANVPIPDILHIERLRADAVAALAIATDGTEDGVVSAYVDLLRLLDRHHGIDAAVEIRAQLDAARDARPEIDRAWQNFECGTNPAQRVGWLPLARPGARIIRVGPGREIETIDAAATAAGDGDLIEIDPGMYAGQVALWPQHRLVIRGAAERPRITGAGRGVQGRDVWLFTGDDIVVENVEISGARSAAENGAAIRHIGSGLTLRYVKLYDNENGLLTGNRHPETNEILVEYSEFGGNGDGKGLAHNIYIGRSKRFELRYSFSHGSRGGHLIKSRARNNIIAYNRLTDGETGTSSYLVDIPEGGIARVVGNMLEQGPATLNHGMISFAGEAQQPDGNRLLVVNNSIYNRDFQGLAVRNHAELDVVMVNNLIGGATLSLRGEGLRNLNNLNLPDHGMTDPRAYDYRLVRGARAIDSGIEFEVMPDKEYVHPVQWRERQRVWRLDVGAYERCGF